MQYNYFTLRRSKIENSIFFGWKPGRRIFALFKQAKHWNGSFMRNEKKLWYRNVCAKM